MHKSWEENERNLAESFLQKEYYEYVVHKVQEDGAQEYEKWKSERKKKHSKGKTFYKPSHPFCVSSFWAYIQKEQISVREAKRSGNLVAPASHRHQSSYTKSQENPREKSSRLLRSFASSSNFMYVTMIYERVEKEDEVIVPHSMQKHFHETHGSSGYTKPKCKIEDSKKIVY